MNFSRKNIATFLAILFHLSGLIGILFTPYKNWFIQNTPFNLCLMVLLLVWCQDKKNSNFFLFLLVSFLVGMGTEITGVHTGKLFGIYQYGNILGPKWNGVPFLIGLNWFVVIFCSAAIMEQIHAWLREKMNKAETQISPRVTSLSLVVDGALLATFFDWVMEPVAMQLGFWHWQNDEVPVYNYACWFVISLVLLVLLRWFRFSKPNHFAVHLFGIQLLFFLALRIFIV